MGIAGQQGESTVSRPGARAMPTAEGGRLPAGLARHLTEAQAAKLAAGRHRQALRHGRILMYRDHIPYVAYLVLEGSVGFELGRGTRLARSVTLSAPLIVGEFQVAHRKPFPMTVRALDKLVVCMLGCPPSAPAAAAPPRAAASHPAAKR